MAYARWLGPGTGTMTALPDVVRALAVKEPAPARPARRHRARAGRGRGVPAPHARLPGARHCHGRAAHHRGPSAVHATVYRTFLAVLSAHGRCGCLTEAHIARLFTAAQAKGESARHCTDAWTNARTALGL